MRRNIEYRISVNAGASKTAEIHTYLYRKTLVSISASKKGVTATWAMRVRKEPDQIITDDISTDVLRKAYLLFALLFNRGLQIDRITVKVDDQTQVFGRKDDGVPFVYSLIGPGNLELNNSWYSLVDLFLSKTQSAISNEKRYIAAYSFLMAQSRNAEIDRFRDLWTSMNAYYKHISPNEKDAPAIKSLIIQLGWGEGVANRNYRNGETDKKRNVDYRTKLYLYKLVSDCFCGLSEKDIESFYTECQSGELSERYQAVRNICSDIKNTFNYQKDVSPLAFVTFEYAYFLRCKYFHGSAPTLLFTKSFGPEISSLRVVNYFLEAFLNTNIPNLLLN